MKLGASRDAGSDSEEEELSGTEDDYSGDVVSISSSSGGGGGVPGGFNRFMQGWEGPGGGSTCWGVGLCLI